MNSRGFEINQKKYLYIISNFFNLRKLNKLKIR